MSGVQEARGHDVRMSGVQEARAQDIRMSVSQDMRMASGGQETWQEITGQLAVS